MPIQGSSIHRRAFLASALATAASAYAQAPIGIGFLGISHSHADAKLKLIRSSSEWRLVGVAESDPKLRDQLRASSVPVLERKELLQHTGIQAIAVESAVRDHARDGLDVVDAGKHLHLEKAPATTLGEFRRILDLAAARGLLVQVGYMWRYHPGVEKMLEAARQGWLGEIYLAKGTIGNHLEAARRPEWAEFAGGVMYELGGHVIDPLVRLKGKPARVTPFLQTVGSASDSLRDNTLAVFEWKGALGFVQSATLQPGHSRYRSIEFRGSNGSAVLRPIEAPELQMFLEKPAGPYQAGIQKVQLPPYRRYIDDFVELAGAIRREKKLRVSAAEDLDVHETLLRASAMMR